MSNSARDASHGNLVIGRFPGESVVLFVGDHRVTVTVCAVRGNKVRLGFEAPKEMAILRGEIEKEYVTFE